MPDHVWHELNCAADNLLPDETRAKGALTNYDFRRLPNGVCGADAVRDTSHTMILCGLLHKGLYEMHGPLALSGAVHGYDVVVEAISITERLAIQRLLELLLHFPGTIPHRIAEINGLTDPVRDDMVIDVVEACILDPADPCEFRCMCGIADDGGRVRARLLHQCMEKLLTIIDTRYEEIQKRLEKNASALLRDVERERVEEEARMAKRRETSKQKKAMARKTASERKREVLLRKEAEEELERQRLREVAAVESAKKAKEKSKALDARRAKFAELTVQPAPCCALRAEEEGGEAPAEAAAAAGHAGGAAKPWKWARKQRKSLAPKAVEPPKSKASSPPPLQRVRPDGLQPPTFFAEHPVVAVEHFGSMLGLGYSGVFDEADTDAGDCLKNVARADAGDDMDEDMLAKYLFGLDMDATSGDTESSASTSSHSNLSQRTTKCGSPAAGGGIAQAECLTCMEPGAMRVCVPCGHLCFCDACADLALATAFKRTGEMTVQCPVCRTDAALIRIFVP